jgi:primosomal protein N' (replication factor Y)
MSSPSPSIAVVVVPKGPEQELHYAVPLTMSRSLQPGLRVEVPLGRRFAVGYFVGFAEKTDIEKLREIHRPLEDAPSLIPPLLKLARWMSDYYQAPLAKAIRLFFPPEEIGPKRRVHLRLKRPIEETQNEFSHLSARAKGALSLLQELVHRGGDAPLSLLSAKSRRAATALIRRGLVERVDRESFRNPFPEIGSHSEFHPPPLTRHQEAALGKITAAIDGGRFTPFLLHGVTGSGKTEVYLRAVDRTIKGGRGAIVLVPEIGLTPNLLARFRERFGDQVILFHSALSAGERTDAWRRARSGTALVAIGARSALFAPLPRLGLVVVDEEQDSSYKQEEGVRYHARDVALIRGQQADAVVILGSATPSLESYQNSLQGKYACLSLPERVEARPLPEVEIVPFPKEAPHVFLTPSLQQAIQNRLESKEQTLLFLNRRGFAPFLLCLECGEVPRCTHCSVSMTLHKRNHVLLCHYCGQALPPPTQCGRCRGTRLKEMGMGTERLEALLRVSFPTARIVRMDRDTTQRKRAHHEILRAAAEGEVDILIGTQMIAKGHDLHRVTLVGILCADLGLHLPDFRASERTFQLLVQVAGRAGRGEQPGEVIVQTYHPDHYTLRYAQQHDVVGFYREELSHRKEGRYPPFCRLTVLRLYGKDEKITEERSKLLAEELNKRIRLAGGKIEMIGPSSCPIERLRGEYRWQILFRGMSNRLIGELIRRVLPTHRKEHSVRIEVDVDPQSLL